jgi:hypothetical protein
MAHEPSTKERSMNESLSENPIYSGSISSQFPRKSLRPMKQDWKGKLGPESDTQLYLYATLRTVFFC